MKKRMIGLVLAMMMAASILSGTVLAIGNETPFVPFEPDTSVPSTPVDPTPDPTPDTPVVPDTPDTDDRDDEDDREEETPIVPVKPSTPVQPVQPIQPASAFTDVAAGAYYAEAVAWAVDNGITNGVGARIFAPNTVCTRAQVVTFLWRAAGSPEPERMTSPFTDVAAGSYYYKAVLWAVEQGITNGVSATEFAPNATVTRGQTVTFLYRAAGSKAVSGSHGFADVAANAYYNAPVLWAVENEVTNGTSATTFSPDHGCTRGQIVTFMYRAME